MVFPRGVRIAVQVAALSSLRELNEPRIRTDCAVSGYEYPMRWRSMLLLPSLLLFLLACGKGAGIDATYSNVGVAGSFTVELNSDLTFEVRQADEIVRGEYTLEGNKLTMIVKEIIGRVKTAADDEPIVGSLSADKEALKLTVNSVQIDFQRK